MASDVQLSVEFIPGDVKQAAAQLQAEIESVFNANVDEKLQVSFARLQQSMQEAYRTAESMKQEMNSLEGTKVETPYMQGLRKYMDDAREELGKLQERMEKFKETGGKTTSRAFKGMTYEAGRLEKQIADIKAEREAVKSMGEQYMPAEDTARYQQLVEKLAQVNNQMKIYSMRARDMINKSAGPKTGTINSWEKLRGTIQKATAALRKFISARLGLSSKSGMLTGMFSGLNNGLSNFTGGLKKGFWTVMKYAFGLRSLFIVTNKVRNALKDGIKNLVQYSATFNRSVSNMLSSLNYLKNSLATAFEPLISVVAPIIVRFVDTIAGALAKVSEFFSALTGRSYFYKAKKVYQDYAASLRSDSDKTTKKVEKLQRTIAGFDDVEILHEPDSTDGINPSAGSGDNIVDPGDMFETLPVSSKMKDLIDKIKDAWRKADFTEIGRIVGEKLRDALNRIDWDKIKKQAEKIAKVTATFLNGFFETPGLWETVGKTIAEGLNTSLTFANTFLKTIHSDSIGRAITTTISNFFKNIDWGLVGETVSHGLARLLDFIRGLIEGIDWSELPKAIIKGIWEFLKGFDWKDFFHSLGQLIGAAIKAGIDFTTATVELVTELIKTLGQYFKDHIQEFIDAGKPLGEAIIKGIFWGIVEILYHIGDWIYNNILEPFISGFKDAFGIHSPSRVMKEMGHYIIEGLLNGILEAIKSIGSWIKENIFQPFIDGFKRLFGINSPSTVMREMGGYIVDGLLSGISSKLSNAKSWVKTNIFDRIKSALNSAFGIAGNVANNLKSVGVSVCEGIKSGASSAKQSIATVFNNIPEKISSIFSQHSFRWSSIGSNIVSGIQRGISNASFLLTSTVSSLASRAFTTARTVLGIHSPSRVFRDEIGKMITEGWAIGIESGETDVLNSMSNITDSLINSVPTEIKLPEIVSGEVIPYDIEVSNKQNITNIMDTLKNLIEMLEYNQDNQIGRDELEQMITTIVQRYMNIDFYIGDEQIARHANAGNERLNRRYNPVLV